MIVGNEFYAFCNLDEKLLSVSQKFKKQTIKVKYIVYEFYKRKYNTRKKKQLKHTNLYLYNLSQAKKLYMKIS